MAQRAIGQTLAELLGDLPVSPCPTSEQVRLLRPICLASPELQEDSGLLMQGDLAEHLGGYRVAPR